MKNVIIYMTEIMQITLNWIFMVLGIACKNMT